MAYLPRADIIEPLQHKTLVMVVGPTAIGKSTIMNEAKRRKPAFRRVSGITTRHPRPNDEAGLYRYITMLKAEEMIKERSLVQYVINPANRQFYGTEPDDFPGQINLQDTLSSSVETYRDLPFNHTIAISITAPAVAWIRWLTQRYPGKDEAYRNRLVEAKQSIEWSLAQTDNHYWLINKPDNMLDTVDTFIATVQGSIKQTNSPHEAQNMLQAVNTLLSYG